MDLGEWRRMDRLLMGRLWMDRLLMDQLRSVVMVRWRSDTSDFRDGPDLRES